MVETTPVISIVIPLKETRLVETAPVISLPTREPEPEPQISKEITKSSQKKSGQIHQEEVRQIY